MTEQTYEPLTLRHLLHAATAIERLGLFGLIWLDDKLTVTETFGRTADFVTRGRPLCDSVAAFHGLEADIAALKGHPRKTLELPAIGQPSADTGNTNEKLNFTVLWDSRTVATVVLVHRSNAQSEIEVELSRQIRARLMSETQLAQTSRELRRANTDLEGFAGIISHDLKAPLRHMRHMVDDALALPVSDLSTEGREKIEQIALQSKRMSDMLTALFDYSSLGRKYEAIEDVATKDIVNDVISQLPTEDFVLSVTGVWPSLKTLRAPLHLVIQNLLANAIQHHDRNAGSGRIEIHGRDEQSAFVMTFADDGPGIDAKHHATVFLPFRTLGTGDAAATGGSGMGLAAVKRVIESLGGTISLDSEPLTRRGTNFTVFWPKTPFIDFVR